MLFKVACWSPNCILRHRRSQNFSEEASPTDFNIAGKKRANILTNYFAEVCFLKRHKKFDCVLWKMAVQLPSIFVRVSLCKSHLHDFCSKHLTINPVFKKCCSGWADDASVVKQEKLFHSNFCFSPWSNEAWRNVGIQRYFSSSVNVSLKKFKLGKLKYIKASPCNKKGKFVHFWLS